MRSSVYLPSLLDEGDRDKISKISASPAQAKISAKPSDPSPVVYRRQVIGNQVCAQQSYSGSGDGDEDDGGRKCIVSVTPFLYYGIDPCDETFTCTYRIDLEAEIPLAEWEAKTGERFSSNTASEHSAAAVQLEKSEHRTKTEDQDPPSILPAADESSSCRTPSCGQTCEAMAQAQATTPPTASCSSSQPPATTRHSEEFVEEEKILFPLPKFVHKNSVDLRIFWTSWAAEMVETTDEQKLCGANGSSFFRDSGASSGTTAGGPRERDAATAPFSAIRRSRKSSNLLSPKGAEVNLIAGAPPRRPVSTSAVFGGKAAGGVAAASPTPTAARSLSGAGPYLGRKTNSATLGRVNRSPLAAAEPPQTHQRDAEQAVENLQEKSPAERQVQQRAPTSTFKTASIMRTQMLTSKCRTQFNLEAFPFDYQELRVALFLLPQQGGLQWDILLKKDHLKQAVSALEESWKDPDWALIPNTFKVERECHVVYGDRILIYVKVKRLWAWYVWNFFLILFLVTILAFSGFVWDHNIEYRNPYDSISISLLAVLTLISFKSYMSQSHIPKVAYMTMLDVYTVASLTTCMATIAVTCIRIYFAFSYELELGLAGGLFVLYVGLFHAIFLKKVYALVKKIEREEMELLLASQGWGDAVGETRGAGRGGASASIAKAPRAQSTRHSMSWQASSAWVHDAKR